MPPQLGVVSSNMLDIQSWVLLIMGGMDQATLYNSISMSPAFPQPANATAVSPQLNFMLCPSAPYRLAPYTNP